MSESERQVKVICPRCRASGCVPWDRLNRVLQCSQCDRWYKIDSLGKLIEIPEPEHKLTVAVRSSFSEWRMHDVTIPRKLTLAERLRTLWRGFRPGKWLSRLSGAQGTALFASTLACIVLVGWSLTAWLSATAETPLPPLPAALEDRVPLFTRAWLANDVPQMLRLTDPVRDRELRRWLAHSPPPATKDPTGGTTVEVAGVERRKADAQVSVRMSLLNAAGNHADTMLSQVWVQRQGTWYFLPSTPPTKKVRTRS